MKVTPRQSAQPSAEAGAAAAVGAELTLDFLGEPGQDDPSKIRPKVAVMSTQTPARQHELSDPNATQEILPLPIAITGILLYWLSYLAVTTLLTPFGEALSNARADGSGWSGLLSVSTLLALAFLCFYKSAIWALQHRNAVVTLKSPLLRTPGK